MATSTQWQLSNDAAMRYEQVIVPAFIGPFAKALIEEAVLPTGATVLDVGCGTGAATRIAAEAVGASGRVIGADVNAGMIAAARSLPVSEGAAIEWYEESAYQLSLPDQSVDAVLAAQVIQFLQDRPLALSEMFRVLKTGGTIAFSTWCALPENPYFAAQLAAIAHHLGADVAAGLRAGFALPDANHIRELVQTAGFTDIEVVPRQLDLSIPDLQEFVPEIYQRNAYGSSL